MVNTGEANRPGQQVSGSRAKRFSEREQESKSLSQAICHGGSENGYSQSANAVDGLYSIGNAVGSKRLRRLRMTLLRDKPRSRVSQDNTHISLTKKRSLLDYSLIICGGIILLLIILIMKGESMGSIAANANNRLSGLSGTGQIEMNQNELLELEEELKEAKELVEEKTAEVSKVVQKVEKEVTPESEKPHTESEKLEEAKKEGELNRARAMD